MNKYIEGHINDYKFVSDEPLTIGVKCVELIPGSNKNGFTIKIMNLGLGKPCVGEYSWKHIRREWRIYADKGSGANRFTRT